MFQKIKDYLLFGLTLGLLVWIFLTMRSCEKSKIGLNTGHDTVTVIKHSVDTIFPDPKIIHDLKIVKIPVPRIDTVFKPVYMDSAMCNRIYVYQDSVIDSNLVWRYKAYTQGVLRDLKSNYTLKVPLKIIDSVKVTTTIVKRPRFALYGGLVASKGIVAPIGEVGLKRISVGLGLNLIGSPTPVFSFKYLILSK